MANARILLVSMLLGGCASTPPPAGPIAPAAPIAAPIAGTSNISGVVVDSKTNEVVPNALVILQSSALREMIETQTNGNGIYAFRDLPPATYTVQVLTGHADVSKIAVLPADSRFRANFRVDTTNRFFVCYLPTRPPPNQSLFSIGKQEAHLLGIPRTKIFN
ncbi:MAG: carboxypeptidase-like regulatory domain-containing protein [Deltaproteobacteria bacterium]|nr:carboxypeptidase-like regulatory domain-containing protein [Deltaproteobacteria bacterium]